MLRLRSCILSHLVSSPSTSPLYSLQRLLTATATATAAPPSPSPPPNPDFAAADYLVAACGLTSPKALKASAKLGHLKSSSNPDAVLAFLRGLGLSGADVAALVARDPLFLCASVDKTLAPRVAALGGLGLSRPEIARLVPLIPNPLRCKSVVAKLRYHIPLAGSIAGLLRAQKRCSYLISSSLERVVAPNVATLRGCGLGPADLAKLYASVPRLLNTAPESVRKTVARAQRLGLPCGPRMFWQVLKAVSFLTDEKVAAKVDCLKKAFRWSDAEVATALSKHPMLLARSDDAVRRVSRFLVSEARLEPAYIAHRAIMLGYALEGRLKPRYYVFRFLKENRFIDRDRDYYTAVSLTEDVFAKKYIHPHKEAAPSLAQDYDAACRGELPAICRSA